MVIFLIPSIIFCWREFNFLIKFGFAELWMHFVILSVENIWREITNSEWHSQEIYSNTCSVQDSMPGKFSEKLAISHIWAERWVCILWKFAYKLHALVNRQIYLNIAELHWVQYCVIRYFDYSRKIQIYRKISINNSTN